MRLTSLGRRIGRCVRQGILLACCTPALSLADCFPTEQLSESGCAGLSSVPLRPSGRHSILSRQQQPRPASTGISTRFEDSFLAVNGGFVGIFNKFTETLRYGLEFRWKALTPLKLRPALGFISAENDASYSFLGVRRDFELSEHWLLTGSFDAGYFEERGELELGLEFEFRSGLELAYRFDNQHRVGVALFHLSNGGFGDRNPGTESAVINITIPLK